MYTLHLMDGTNIKNLKKIKKDTFKLKSENSQIHFLLTPYNLTIAFLTERNMLEDVFVDYVIQNYSWDGTTIQFKIAPYNEVFRISNREKKKIGRMGK